MEFVEEILRFFTAAGNNRRLVLLGTMLLGISSGAVGCFALLRKQSLLGDTMAHAALPGVCLVFLLTGYKDPFLFLLGASFTGLLGAGSVFLITQKSRLKVDAAMALVLSVFYGCGIVILTYIQQQTSSGNQAGLDVFLFGKAASLLRRDVYVMLASSAVILLTLWLFYKEFKIISFDPGFAASLGVPVKFFDLFLTSLLVLAIMVGLQAVGVVLMVAMVIMPAAAARQWTERLGVMIVISCMVGAFSGAVGTIISALYPKTPTGPVMVIVASSILIISIFCAPQRGLLSRWYRLWQTRLRIQKENLLKAIYKMEEDNPHKSHFFSLATINSHLHLSLGKLWSLLWLMSRQKLIALHNQSVALQPKGRQQAKRILRNHRLWELYLSSAMNLPIDHVHRDAENIEHMLPNEVVAELEKELHSPAQDPHGREIPRV